MMFVLTARRKTRLKNLAITMEKLNANGNVNRRVKDFAAEADTPLLWAIREQLGLTSTQYGCGEAQCGACTVHIDGVPIPHFSLCVIRCTGCSRSSFNSI